MGRVGGRRTLQAYTRGVLEANSKHVIELFCVKSFIVNATRQVCQKGIVCGG